MGPEKKIQNEIISYLNSQNFGFFWQNDSVGIKGRKRANQYRPNGVPDVLGVMEGKFIAIEVKSETGKMSLAQHDFRDRFESFGGTYILARSLADVMFALGFGGIF